MTLLLFLIAASLPPPTRDVVSIELVHEMYGSTMANEFDGRINDVAMFGAKPRSMVCNWVAYEHVGDKYLIRSRWVTCKPGRFNRGPVEIPVYADQLIGVRVTYADGRVEVVR